MRVQMLIQGVSICLLFKYNTFTHKLPIKIINGVGEL